MTKNKIALRIILTNLFIGNVILLCGDNFPLMVGMSGACVLYYCIFFHFSYFLTYRKIKLALLSILNCMVIIVIGNFFALCIDRPNEILSNLPTAILMGIIANIVLFPISLGMGTLNFVLTLLFVKKLKEKLPSLARASRS